MTSVVFGGAGFIGSHLCKRLLDEGRKVICIDNLYTGQQINVDRLLEYSVNFTFIKQDILDKIELFNIDEIYNLACPASPIKYQKDPIYTFKICTIGNLNILELARKNNARILLASTSEVYGNPLIKIQDESYFGNVNPDGIRSCYDEGKRGAETLFCDYYRQYNVDTRIIRIFNTYGPNMDKEDGRVISNFINQALSNKDITVNGDGLQTRSFQYIDDLVEGILKVMELDDYHTPINLGNPSEYTVINLAKVILNLIDTKSNIIYRDLPSDDPLKRHPDISLAKKLLNWEPKISLKEGLIKTIEYFKSL